MAIVYGVLFLAVYLAGAWTIWAVVRSGQLRVAPRVDQAGPVDDTPPQLMRLGETPEERLARRASGDYTEAEIRQAAERLTARYGRGEINGGPGDVEAEVTNLLTAFRTGGV